MSTVAPSVTVGDVLAGLYRWAPPDRAASWDAIGLHVGDPHSPVSKAVVVHEVDEGGVAAAIEAEADLMVTYHPLLFRPISRLVTGSDASGLALRLARHGIALICAHTNADAATGGMSDALADAIGLVGVEAFGTVQGVPQVKIVVFVPPAHVGALRDAMAESGAGTIGLYRACSFESAGVGRFVAGDEAAPAVGAAGIDNEASELRLEMIAPRTRESAVVAAIAAAHPYEEPVFDVYDIRGQGGMIGRVGDLPQPMTPSTLGLAVASALGDPPVRVAAESIDVVRRVAVVPGSGSDFAPAARDAGADALVTGDVRHHAAMAANRSGLAIIDATHAATERPGMGAMYRAVSDIVPALDLTHLPPNPWTSP